MGLTTTIAPKHLSSSRWRSWSFGCLPGQAELGCCFSQEHSSCSEWIHFQSTASKSLPGAGKVLWLPQNCFIPEAFGSTCCPRGEVLQDTSPVLGKVSPGLVAALVLARWQRVEAGDGPGHVSGTTGFTQARCSRHLQGQSFSEHLTYTGSRGGCVGHSTAAEQSRMDSRGRKEGPLVCFYILYVCL